MAFAAAMNLYKLTKIDKIAKMGVLRKRSSRRDLPERRMRMAIPRSRSRHSHALAIRNRRGEDPIRISATEAKNKLGEVLDNVVQSGMVLITKHDTPKAVLLSMEEYGALSRATQSRLDTLSGEFDALLSRMQTPKARSGRKAAFAASPKQLGKAAVAPARIRDDRKRAG
jgi:antitoxin Phd